MSLTIMTLSQSWLSEVQVLSNQNWQKMACSWRNNPSIKKYKTCIFLLHLKPNTYCHGAIVIVLVKCLYVWLVNKFWANVCSPKHHLPVDALPLTVSCCSNHSNLPHCLLTSPSQLSVLRWEHISQTGYKLNSAKQSWNGISIIPLRDHCTMLQAPLCFFFSFLL